VRVSLNDAVWSGDFDSVTGGVFTRVEVMDGEADTGCERVLLAEASLDGERDAVESLDGV
jgi:hypothetical protein